MVGRGKLPYLSSSNITITTGAISKMMKITVIDNIIWYFMMMCPVAFLFLNKTCHRRKRCIETFVLCLLWTSEGNREKKTKRHWQIIWTIPYGYAWTLSRSSRRAIHKERGRKAAHEAYLNIEDRLRPCNLFLSPLSLQPQTGVLAHDWLLGARVHVSLTGLAVRASDSPSDELQRPGITDEVHSRAQSMPNAWVKAGTLSSSTTTRDSCVEPSVGLSDT